MKQKIPVWVINLKKRPDRLLNIGKRLNQLDINWSRINAVDGQNCDPELLKISKEKGEIGELSKSTRGCSASHFKFWQKFLLSDYEFGIVLEDDIDISNDFKELICSLSWIPKETNIIKLEKFASNRPSKLLLGSEISNVLNNTRFLHRMYSRHCGAGAYLLSKPGVKILLKHGIDMSVPVDHFLFNETVSKTTSILNPLILVPPIAWQSTEIGQGSDINKNENKSIPKLKKIMRSLKRGYYEIRLWPYQLYLLLIGKAKIVSISKK